MTKDRKLIDLDSMESKEEKDVVTNENEEVTTVSEGEQPEDISSILNKITSKKKIKNEKTQVSIYLDEDVYKKYIRFGKKWGKGSRSDLVNEMLRKALEEY